MRLAASVEVDGRWYHAHAENLTLVSGTLVISHVGSDRTRKRALVDMRPIFYNESRGYMLVSNNSIRKWMRTHVKELEYSYTC